MPIIGLGTLGPANSTAVQVAEVVKRAILMGYRFIDCASKYNNEKEIGIKLKKLLDYKVIGRDELWVTSKLWNDMHNKVFEALQDTLKNLSINYLDLYLVHWPFRNYKGSVPVCYNHEDFMDTWRQMEQLVDLGYVKHIGTSNMSQKKMELLLKDCRIKPFANEMEIHPHFQQTEFCHFLLDHGIQPIAFCPVGSPGRPAQIRSASDTVPTEDPVIRQIAAKHSINPATVCIKWSVQKGYIPVPFSMKDEHLLSNLQCASDNPLSDCEMEEINSIDKNCRLIKGEQFLWDKNSSWHTLWDEN